MSRPFVATANLTTHQGGGGLDDHTQLGKSQTAQFRSDCRSVLNLCNDGNVTMEDNVTN